jgi:hypothetical protein
MILRNSSGFAHEGMIAALLEADPSFGPVWKKYAAEWPDEAARPLYPLMGELSRHLIAQLQHGETARFRRVFAVVEEWLESDDDAIWDITVMGLIEDLQNENLHTATKPGDFKPWLGPDAAVVWEKVARFWLRRELIER